MLSDRLGLQGIGGRKGVPLGHALADAVLLHGLKRDGVHEVFAARIGDEGAATGFALALAARLVAKGKWLLWVRQDFSTLEAGELHACGLLDLGLDPGRVVVVRVPDATAALRAGAEGIACKGFAAVLIEVWGEPKVFDLVASRKLTLGAQQYEVTPILLRFGATPHPSAAETRWLVQAAPSVAEDWETLLFDAALVRNRHGQTGQWVMEWDCRHGCFGEAHPRAVAAAAAHRPAEAAVEGFRQAG